MKNKNNIPIYKNYHLVKISKNNVQMIKEYYSNFTIDELSNFNITQSVNHFITTSLKIRNEK